MLIIAKKFPSCSKYLLFIIKGLNYIFIITRMNLKHKDEWLYIENHAENKYRNINNANININTIGSLPSRQPAWLPHRGFLILFSIIIQCLYSNKFSIAIINHMYTV